MQCIAGTFHMGERACLKYNSDTFHGRKVILWTYFLLNKKDFLAQIITLVFLGHLECCA